MDLRDRALPPPVAELADEATTTVQRWVDSAAGVATPASERRLTRLLADPAGARFAIAFVDGVLRPDDLRVASRNLDRLSRRLPEALRWHAGLGAQLAGGFAPLAPGVIVPLARDAFLGSIGHLLLRLDGPDLDRQLAELTAPGGIRPILAPIAAVASGRHEAGRQVADARELLGRPDVSCVSISLASVVGRPALVDLDRVVDSAVELLAPLAELAAASGGGKSIEFDIQRLDELAVTLRVLRALGERHGGLRLGVGVAASLPESLSAVEGIAEWARGRGVGFAPVTVRVTKGGQLAEELLRGQPPAPWPGRAERDAQFLRILDRLLIPELAGSVRVVAASNDLFEAAWAWRLARRRRVEGSLEHEFPLGVLSGHAAAAKRDLGGIRVAAPVVQHGQLTLAAPSLIRLLGDLAGIGEEALGGSEERFRASLARAAEAAPPGSRRYDPVRVAAADFTMEAARDWARGVLERVRDSAAGEALLARTRLSGVPELLLLVERTVAAGREWGRRRGSTRAAVLDSVAELLAEWRGLLVEVAVSESGLVIAEADAEVTTAIGLARRAAQSARELDRIADAVFHPPKLTVVVSPRSGPIARPAGAVLAALAAGSAVILKTAPETRRSSAVLIETLVAGGVPQELLGLVDDEGELAHELVGHPAVDRVLLDGSRHTAKLFHSWRAELPLVATTGGRNAIIVTPSADLESAVPHLVASAFDHAGQSATATDTVILVGSVGEDDRFLGRLRDAVASLSTGWPGSPHGICTLARPAAGRTLDALETLEAGEDWLVRPRRGDGSGRMWSPGLRDGVLPSSAFRTGENRAPVLGIMRAGSLAEAIELQNAPGFGLTAGIQALDAEELAEWLDRAQAGMLFANRPVVAGYGALIPFSGWNRSRIGPGVAQGGPHELVAAVAWSPVASEPGTTVSLDGVAEPVARLIEAAMPAMSFEDFDRVRAGALSDAVAWREWFSAPVVLSDLGIERHLLRYRPVPVTLRAGDGVPPAHLIRVLAAAALAGAAVAISTAVPLPAGLIDLFGARDAPIGVAEVLVESETRWRARVQAGELATTRIRLLGEDRLVLARVLHGQPGVAVHANPVTTSGRVELLPFLIEQTVTTAVQRFGLPWGA